MDYTPSDPLIGSRVAQYAIVAKLGGGGMGVVYKATDTKLGRTVALKFLPPQWSHDESAKQRFLREAQAASATNHPNICVIHDIEQTDDGRLFIVMAHYEGQTLKQKLEGGAIPLYDALDIAYGVALGLAKAHAQGVVHRDIKPGNLIVSDDGVKIVDFGLATFADAVRLTIEGSTIGTVAYMSPEQARGDEADARSDIWALGVVLFEMLSGELPFKGAYPEAVFYAIKNEPVPAPRVAGGEISGPLNALVLRTLEKDPDKRYQSARELARDLRLLQGLTLPVDLQGSPFPLTPSLASSSRTRLWQHPMVASAVVLVGLAACTYLWLTWPVERIHIAVAPLVNQTEYAELDSYRLALTQALGTALAESGELRVFSYERLLQVLRRFLAGSTDVSSREAVQALARVSAAQFVIVPTLVHENGAWHARAELRSTETTTNVAVLDTDPVVSSLMKETVYGLMPSLAERVQHHFTVVGPRRRYALDALRRALGYKSPPIVPRSRTLDAAKAFEEGLNAYEQLEYEASRRAFEHAAQLDPRSPVLFMWLSRAALIVRHDDEAQQAGEQAARLVETQLPVVDQLQVAAVSAEARRDFATAETRYRDLVSRHPDDSAWLVELASFQDRRGRAADAIVSYRRALAQESTLARPHLELCRMYNRLGESASAKQAGEDALTAYRALGNPGGAAQALMCLTDRLRLGDAEERVEARRYAEEALKTFQDRKYAYNMPRAQYYVALAAEMQGRPVEAIAFYEQALAGARTAGNVVLQPLVLMNLGAMHVRNGSHSRALDYYRQSFAGFEALGDQRRAAENRANAGVILAEFGDKPEDGLREVQNALGVFRQLEDKDFEVFAAKVAAAVHRNGGRYQEAERELNRALGIAKARDLKSKIAALTIDLGLSRFDRADYATARKWLLDALGDGGGQDSVQTRIHLGRLDVRIGDFQAARRDLERAARDVRDRADNGWLPLLYLALGELAYESGQPSAEARRHFSASAALWTDDLPEPASVEAFAWLGFLDDLEGRSERGALAVQTSVDQARKTKQYPLEARCRLHLARIQIHQRKFDDALTTLRGIAPDDERTLGPEIQAQAHHWRSVALTGKKDHAAASVEWKAAQGSLEALRTSLPEGFGERFASRVAIRPLVQ